LIIEKIASSKIIVDIVFRGGCWINRKAVVSYFVEVVGVFCVFP